MTRILLTGAATLVGAEVLGQLLERPDVESIRLLMPVDEGQRSRAVDRLQNYLAALPPSVSTFAGDARLPRFGMSSISWSAFAESFDVAFHCAQREINDQNVEAARQANLLPAENWIDLLQRNRALRLHHLSTAFVGGTRRGLLTEFDLDCGQGFHNAWERSKFEAERRLRESPASDRVTIYRPSHTLGRATGEAFHLGGAYPLLSTLAAGWLLPGDARARLDFIPADYVAKAMVALALSEATGTFHLACGWAGSLPVRQAAALAAKGRGRNRGPWLLPRAVAWPLQVGGVATIDGLVSRNLAFEIARDLLHQGPVFDTYRADLALAPLGIERPRPESWLEAAVRAAETRAWKAPPQNELEEPAAVAEVVLIRGNPLVSEKRFHQIGEVNVAYRDIGEGDPVVFLHGFAGADAWDGVVERIAAHRRAIVVETLGLSDTQGPPSADFGLPAQAARVRGLLSALGIAETYVVGNDTGGLIAQFFAVRWPHCVKGLVLSDCAAQPHAAAMAGMMAIPGGTSLMKIPAVARSRFGFGRLVHDKRVITPERVARYADTVAGTRERRLRLKRFVRSLPRTDLATLKQQLAHLEVPTMLIWGAEDAGGSLSWARTLYESIPGARRLELIPFAGISCHEERPDLFAHQLSEFFDEVESGYQSRGRRALTSRL